MQTISKPRSTAFTLVELLVVIAIIAILISILLPVLLKVRRKAVVLASPIVYRCYKDNSLHVCDPKGNFDTNVTPSYGWFHARRPGNPTWSPSGRVIGFEVSNWPLGNPALPQYMCILDPMSGIISQHLQTNPNPRNYFEGWWDSDHFIEATGNATFYIRNAETGGIVNTIQRNGPRPYGPFYLVPPGLSGRWIVANEVVGAGPGATYQVIVKFIRSDFSDGKTVCLPPPGPMQADGEDYPIDVDWLGEWIAWTVSDGNNHKTAIKRVADPSSMQPSYLNFSGYFGQWTEDGNMLFSTSSGWAVLDKYGNTVRTFSAPNGSSSWASWRHYGHR
jgi:prepilin-type N-terminal cleavage/methylation domain-containing protein